MVHFHEGVHHIQHAVAHAGAQIEHIAAGVLRDVLHRRHMTLGKIHHMDVVPDTGAVRGVVVVAEYGQLFPAAHCHLGDKGHQVVGDASGILADASALMGADGVEIPQQADAPVLVGKGDAGKDLLGHVLRPAVGVGAAAGTAVFPQGHPVVRGIDRRGGGEDQILAARFPHDLGEHQGGIQVVVIVRPGLADALAHGLQPREVDHAADFVFRENPAHQVFIPHVSPVKAQGLAGDLPHPVQRLGVGIAQVVHHGDFIAGIQQLHAGMGADIAGAAGNQYIHKYRTSDTGSHTPQITDIVSHPAEKCKRYSTAANRPGNPLFLLLFPPKRAII